MASNSGLFQWIREGVRQSVLLGVSDALESIGTPEDSSKLHPALMALSQPTSGSGFGVSSFGAIDSEGAVRKVNPSASKKRLGRSLKDIETPAKPAS
jgi:hypothetical protein